MFLITHRRLHTCRVQNREIEAITLQYRKIDTVLRMWDQVGSITEFLRRCGSSSLFHDYKALHVLGAGHKQGIKLMLGSNKKSFLFVSDNALRVGYIWLGASGSGNYVIK